MPAWCVDGACAGEVAIVVEVVLAMLGLDFFSMSRKNFEKVVLEPRHDRDHAHPVLWLSHFLL